MKHFNSIWILLCIWGSRLVDRTISIYKTITYVEWLFLRIAISIFILKLIHLKKKHIYFIKIHIHLDFFQQFKKFLKVDTKCRHLMNVDKAYYYCRKCRRLKMIYGSLMSPYLPQVSVHISISIKLVCRHLLQVAFVYIYFCYVVIQRYIYTQVCSI